MLSEPNSKMSLGNWLVLDRTRMEHSSGQECRLRGFGYQEHDMWTYRGAAFLFDLVGALMPP